MITIIALALIAGTVILYMNNHWVTGTLLLICMGGLQYRETTKTDKDERTDTEDNRT